MANNNVIGLAIGLDTTSLKAGLADANRRLKESNAQFKAATSGMDNFASSSKGLSAKLKQLNDNLSIQEAALAMMEEEYRKNHRGQNDMSAAAVKLRTQIANQQAAIGKTKRDLEKYTKALEEMDSKSEEVEDATKDVNKALKNTDDAAKEASDGFTVMKGTVANLLASGISKLASGLTNLATSLLSTAEATREYREDMGRLDAAFASSDKSAESATATYQKLYGAIGETDTAVEAAQQIALLADSEERAAQWADLATGVVGKFGDALKPETFYEAANETIKLNEATGAFTQMLEQSGIDVEKFNEGLAACTTEAEKQAYMLEVSNGALGEAGKAYEEVNDDIIKAREETAEYADVQAKLGKKMEPVSSAINTFKTKLAEALLENVDFEAVAEKLSGVLDKLAEDVLPAVINGLKWLVDNLPELAAGAVALGSAWAGMKIASVVTGIVKAVKSWTIAQKALNTAMKANIIGAIVGLIIGLIAYIVYLWNTNEEFREAVINIWEAIKNAFKVAWEAIKKAWDKAGEFFSNVWKSITKTFSNVGKWFKNIFKDAWEGVKSVFSKVGSFFGGIWDTIKEKFENIGQKVGDAISSTFKAAVNGLLSAAETVLNTPIKGINAAIGLVNKALPKSKELGTIKEFSLPRMAKGGIVNSATLGIFGEDGQEAVIPLERNLGWIKKLSANIVKEMNYVNVNGLTAQPLTTNNTQFTQIINAPAQPPLDDMYRYAGDLLNMKKVKGYV